LKRQSIYNLNVLAMKNFKVIILTLAVVLTTSFSFVNAQEEAEEASSFMDVGMDVYSSYIWRGAKFGTGAAFQPWVEASFGGLAIGAWGSVNTGVDEAFEADLYASYSFDFGLGLGISDYYFGASTDTAGNTVGWTDGDAHYFEPAVSYEIGNFSAMVAYMFAPNFEEGDTYIEAAYSIGGVLDVTLGVGDGAYTDDGEFSVCNISLGTSKEIAVTDKFSLPVSGSVTLNPSTQGFYIAAGISF
jgi:hypothetical protein